MKKIRRLPPASCLLVISLLAACTRPLSVNPVDKTNSYIPYSFSSQDPTKTPFLPPTRNPSSPVLSPTPDEPHPVPTVRTQTEQYIVQVNDTLNSIARKFGIDGTSLANANALVNENYLQVGQILTIPAPMSQEQGSDFKIIPDSELVYGPFSASFDLAGFVTSWNGFLNQYHEEVDGAQKNGIEIINQVSREYSVNPRMLLVILEYQSGWLTQNQGSGAFDYPLGLFDPGRAGLFRQMSFAANNLNRGYYLWKANVINNWSTKDGALIPIAPTINAGTAGVQYLMSLLYDRSNWQVAVSSQGLAATYARLFGYPFDYAFEPLIPSNLSQPSFQLPFESGQIWSFTGGPHSAWGDGAAWAALDFAPPDDLGCGISPSWTLAVHDGLIVRVGDGEVVEDLDGDGYEQTGWTILYMHISSTDVVDVGTFVKAGDRIGHASCEGGISNGTHVHIARRYNGEWISAGGRIPFIMDGWVAASPGVEYDGTLTRNGVVVEAWNARKSENQISR